MMVGDPQVQTAEPEGTSRAPDRRTLRACLHRAAMRPRRLLVKVHRWTSIGLMAWLVVVSVTGAWLVFDGVYESWLHPDRYAATDGDVGPQAAADAVVAAGDGAEVTFLTMSRTGRGVYQVFVEVPIEGAPEPATDEEPPHEHFTYFVDPGTGDINGRTADTAGVTWWLYRGHMSLWQDYGLFGAFDPDTGWCRADVDGVEPGGLEGVVCDVIPDGMDMVGWLAVMFVVVLLTGFYLWYWPGVRRWATALVIKRGPRSVRLQSVAAQGDRVRRVDPAARRRRSPASRSPSRTSTPGSRTPRRPSATSSSGPNPRTPCPAPPTAGSASRMTRRWRRSDALPGPGGAVVDAAVRDLDVLGVGHPWVRPVDTRGRRRQRVRRRRPVQRRDRL